MPDSTPQPPAGPVETAIPLVPSANPPADGRPRRDQRRRSQPLPDPKAIMAVTVPDTAPPYDDIVAQTQLTRPAGRMGNDTPGRGTGMSSAAARPAAKPRTAQPATREPSSTSGRPVTAQPSTDRAAAAWPGQFAQVLAETLAGSRPPEQLTSWTTEQARQRIRQLGPLLATAERPRVRRVLVASPAADVLEMTVIIGIGGRIRALAVRLERPDPTALPPRRLYDSRRPVTPQWLCTAVEAA